MTPLLEAYGVAIEGRLEPADLRCGAGEMVAVVGPNGAGKTSLLRALAGIELDRGSVDIAGERIATAPPTRRMRLLSFLPATRTLIWPISARDVIALGLPAPDIQRTEELIDLLELRRLADRPVNRLSTGERSRVLLARALAARPRVLLLDEPLSNLDPYWVLRTLQVLRETASRDRCVVLASLHDLAQLHAFDRALLIDDGRIVAEAGPADILRNSAFSRAFRVERAGDRWRISDPSSLGADLRSSP